jgi:hypothetical protein
MIPLRDPRPIVCPYCGETFWVDVWIRTFRGYCDETCHELANRGLDWKKMPIHHCVEIDLYVIKE